MMIASRIPNTNKLRKILSAASMTIGEEYENTSDLFNQSSKYKPDVILLDVVTIEEDQQIVNEIISKFNIPVIILSTRSVHDTANTVYAITKGASDFILCDQLSVDAYAQTVINKIRSAVCRAQNKIKNIKAEKKYQVEYKQLTTNIQKLKVNGNLKDRSNSPYGQIVAIGTSTGGPKALQAVLTKLPKNFPAPILIVQHMPSGFTKSLANRLDNVCKIRVKEAIDGERLQAGTAYIAPGDYHMKVNDYREISLNQERERDGHRPSVNVLFESIANLQKLDKLVLILTGMGKDGANGVTKMKSIDKDTIVIVESEKTAIINGMPKATLNTGLANEVVHLEKIGDTIIHYILKRGN